MDLLNSLWNWGAFSWSATRMNIGLTTHREWLAIAAIIIGATAATLGEIHRRRIVRRQEKTNALLTQLVDVVIRIDGASRKEFKNLITTLERGQGENEINYLQCRCGDCPSRHAMAREGKNQASCSTEDGEI